MAGLNAEKIAQLPDEMLSFTLASASQRLAPRLGSLAVKGRTTIQTPNYIGNTSRGVLPHISQDNQRKHINITGLYMGLEDFIEKLPPRVPAIYELQSQNGISPLKAYSSHTSESLLILGPRRIPEVVAPTGNSNAALSICTSVGFRSLPVAEYIEAATKLQPDICIGPSDVIRDRKPSVKRAEKMSDRTAMWIRDAIAAKEASKEDGGDITIFAPILPIEKERQRWYLDQLVEDFRDGISGLAIYDASSLGEIDENLESLARLALTEPKNPRELLHQISLGGDLFVLPFINLATEAGIAFSFHFPPPQADGTSGSRQPLGVDTWNVENATDLSPLKDGCQCHTCTRHHRAFLQHLLSAKEMLAWALLQLHNHHVMDQFFAGVRHSIATNSFEKDKTAFETYYETELSEKTIEGPRLRGYQTKSKGGDPKMNRKGYNKLDDMAETLAEAEVPSHDVDAMDLEEHGLGQVSK